MQIGLGTLQAVAFVSAANFGQHSDRVGPPTHVYNLLAYESVRNEGTRICVISSPPLRCKLFALEKIEEPILARPDREALANAASSSRLNSDSSPGKVATISGRLRKPVILPAPKDNIVRTNVAVGQIAPRIRSTQRAPDARKHPTR
jgi:hypothetical protein